MEVAVVLQPADVDGLPTAGKDALLQALAIALVADGEPSREELARFEHVVGQLPWGRDKAELQALARGVLERLGRASGDGKLAVLRELATNIPGAELREKLVLDMASIVAADRVATTVERTTIGTFVMVFGLDPEQTMARLKAHIPAADVAREQGVKLEDADLAPLDDAQKLAVLEALVTGVVADGKATQIELALFDKIVRGLSWGMERAVLDAEVRGIGQRIAALKGHAAVSDFLVGMAARLPSQALREKVFYTAASIMLADGSVSKLEDNTLGALVLAFGIPSERLAAIKLALTGRSSAPPPANPSAS